MKANYKRRSINKFFLKKNPNIKWHFIGRMQSNKIRKIVYNFDYIHSVDSYKKLLKVSNAANELEKCPTVMLQIKLADDPAKGGFYINNLIENWEEIKKVKGIRVKGLMTINPKGLSSKENLKLFNKCREIANMLNLPDCSMGMSQDWEEAVEAGTTWLRLGSIIFGERNI